MFRDKKAALNIRSAGLFSRWGKKAQEELVLPPAFLIAIGLGIVFLTILYAVLTIGSNEAYDRQLAVNSLGLDLQSIQSFGNDINADRDITDGGPYYLVFESGKVYTREKGVQTSTFLFTHVPNFFFRGGEFYPEDKKTIGPLTLFKRGMMYGVAQPSKVPSKYLLVCDMPTGKPLKNIVVDPGHGFDGTTGEEGHTIASLNTKESTYTMNLARSFLISAGSIKTNPTRALDTDSPASLETRQNTQGDALISLHVGSRTDNADVVKAYYNANNLNSRRLACEILNAMTAEFNIPVRPIPVDAEHLSPDDAKQILKGKRPAIFLEIGNAQKKDKSILADTSTISNAIFNGVKTYGVE